MSTVQKISPEATSRQDARDGQDAAAVPPGTRPRISAGLREVAASALSLSGLVGAMAFVVYSMFSWLQWQSFTVRSWDLGIFTQ